jgi:hypothetical protein
MRVDEQKPDERRLGWTSKPCIAKSISIKGRGRRSGNCAWKAAGITPGDLTCCRPGTTGGVEILLERRQKSAEGIVVARAAKA